MSYGSVAYPGADAGAVGFEGAAGELASIVSDKPIGHTEAASDPFDELDGGSRRDGSHGLHLRPFRELVDGDV